MFRIISLFILLLTVIALLSGEVARLSGGAEIIHSLTVAGLFDLSQTWMLVHFGSLTAVLLFNTVALVLILISSPVNGAAFRSSVLLGFATLMQLALDGFVSALNLPELAAIAHLMLGYILIWCAFKMLLQYRPVRVKEKTQTLLSYCSTVLMLPVLMVLLSGEWVSLNHAGLACLDAAQCIKLWWSGLNLPVLVSDIDTFFKGQLAPLSAESLVYVFAWHQVLVALLTVLSCLLVGYGLFTKTAPALKIAYLSLISLLLIAAGLGIVAVNSSLSLELVIAHSGFAGLFMLPLIAIRFFSRYEYFEFEQELEETLREVVQEQRAEPDYKEPAPESIYLRLKSQLKKTRSGLGGALAGISFGSKKAGADLLEELETSLILADVGMDATTEIINRLKNKLEREQLNDAELLLAALKQEMLELLQPCSQPLIIPKQDTPYVILVVGINGVGKTTTIGKMAKRLQAQGHSVMLAAGDTFRAAAVEQLQIWGQRNNIHVVAQHTGADSASVIFDGVQSALAKNVDVLIADTAGRLHTKSNLMDELKKVKRIMAKVDEAAPHEVLLVLDAGTGQNAISQTALFNETVGLTGLVLTKLDGTAKGGILMALAKQFGIPIRYIGIGEGIDDLQDFDAHNFIDALFVKDD